jgi:MoxR-like ATPase
MFNLWLNYPSFNEEVDIVKSTTSQYLAHLSKVVDADELITFQNLVRKVPVADNVVEYTVKLVNQTRPNTNGSHKYIKDWISWGAGPRASQYLILAAKTKAIIDGRYTPNIDDINSSVIPVLRHRLILNFNAEADGVSTLDIINKLLEAKTL